MSISAADAPLTADAHAHGMVDYFRQGRDRAMTLGNRGPLKLDRFGKLETDILEAYRKHGFYVFEGVICDEELTELRDDVDRVLDSAPKEPDSNVDRHGRPAFGLQFQRNPFRFSKPLSDPLGGTNQNNGRHPVKVLEPIPDSDAPAWTIGLLHGNLHLMDSCLRLYGHSGLLAACESVLGPDFVPYTEVTFVKEPGLGPSVAWHQDGTTHWDAPDWDSDAHGFNFMAQLYPSTPGNGVWVLPGSHKDGKVDIAQLVKDSGSERISDAVPLVCDAGDVFMTNRQLVHGSFANSSPERRVTINAGFFARKRVIGVKATRLNGDIETYEEDRILERSRVIAIAIDARRQRFPKEESYIYQPLSGQEANNRWNEETRLSVVKDYNLRDCFI